MKDFFLLKANHSKSKQTESLRGNMQSTNSLSPEFQPADSQTLGLTSSIHPLFPLNRGVGKKQFGNISQYFIRK